MISKKNFTLLFSLLLILSCAETNTPLEEDIQARRGRIHVTKDQLDESPILNITGEAAFYWGQFIDPLQPPPITEYTKISEDWGGLYPEQGDVSIRLIVEKDPIIDQLAFSINSIYSSYRMYINGKLVSSSGKPSMEKGRRQLHIKRKDVIFYSNGSGPLDVVFHISNTYYHRNGIKGLQIGTPQAINQDFYWTLFYDCLTLGILLAMTLYHFILTISKTNRTYILFFALLTMTITFRFFVVGSKLVCDVFPHMNFITFDRLQRLGIYPIAGFFITYLYHLYPREGHKTLVRIVQIATVLFSSLSFVVSPQLVSGVLFTAFYPFFIIVVIEGLFIITNGMIRKEEDALPMAVGVLILIFTAIFDMLVDRDVFPSYNVYYMDKGMILFIFVQAYIISKRINRAYLNEKLFREALQGVQSRLELTVEGAQLGLIEWDILHNTWYMNDNFSTMFGFKKDHGVLTRRHWLEKIHPDDVKEIDTLLKGALSGRIGNFRREYRLRTAEGSYRWCMLLGKVIQQNKLGGAEWFVGLHIDISEKKRNEKALTQIIHADKKNLEKVREEAELFLRTNNEDDTPIPF